MHWGFESVECNLLKCFPLTDFVLVKISHYWFNRQELLEKAKDRYHNSSGKDKAAECYIANKDFLKEKARNEYKNLSEKEKEEKREYS